MKRLIELVEKYQIRNEFDHQEIIPNVVPYSYRQPVIRQVNIEKPFCALILQGEKQVLYDGQELYVGAGKLNISVVDMPIQANIFNASPERPFYGLVLHLDLDEIAKMIGEYHLRPKNNYKFQQIISSDISAPLEDAFYRLLRLYEQPSAIPILMPLIRQEIYYWLLQLPESSILYQAIQQGSHQHQIRKATLFLRNNFSRTLSIKELADYVQMSQSNFYLHFRRITGISPLQFQKQLRLQKARQLIVLGKDVSSAAFDVGYESLSQFSREYKRHFGSTPNREWRQPVVSNIQCSG